MKWVRQGNYWFCIVGSSSTASTAYGRVFFNRPKKSFQVIIYEYRLSKFRGTNDTSEHWFKTIQEAKAYVENFYQTEILQLL